MYELNLGAPSGDLVVALTPEAAESVKLAVLQRLAHDLGVKPEEAKPVKKARAKKASKRDTKRRAILAVLPDILHGDSQMVLAEVTEEVVAKLDDPTSPSYVEACLRELMEKGKVARVRVGHGFGYWLAPDVTPEEPRPFEPALQS